VNTLTHWDLQTLRNPYLIGIFGAGFYLLARFEGLADRKVYSVNRYFISGHSLEHLCFAMVTLILTVMLSFRNIKITRYQFNQCSLDLDSLKSCIIDVH
jgi:hypothetical protein